MKKLISLIKACMTDNMGLFKIKSKKQTKSSKIMLPIFLFMMVFFSIWSYANMIMEPLINVHLEFVLLTLFVLFTFIFTLLEGIYKSSNLLFNCKDDNLLFSLPIKKSTILFIRIFKFYIFELLYNTMFMLPAMVVYARYVPVNYTYYVVSAVMLLLLPIIPIIISCIIGSFISSSSSKFKFKNLAQTIITTLILLVVLYISFNIENIANNLAKSAASINELITKLYYPAGAYIKLITDFNIKELLLFIIINVLLFISSIIVLSSAYFKINSRTKDVKTSIKNSNYKIKVNKPINSLIKKEFKRFANSPVFITNTAFGLVMFLLATIMLVIKFDNVATVIATQDESISLTMIKSYLPVILFILICFASLMSSITSSMISLEGKSFNILKSLPISSFTIILSKILTAIVIMLPFILIGDLIIIISFKFTILEVIIILLSSVILPMVSETIGIIINLKYPKMDAENDTQVVKQSMSSMIAVSSGMALLALTIYLLFKGINYNISPDLLILHGLLIYTLICILLLLYLTKKSVKEFNLINA